MVKISIRVRIVIMILYSQKSPKYPNSIFLITLDVLKYVLIDETKTAELNREVTVLRPDRIQCAHM